MRGSEIATGLFSGIGAALLMVALLCIAPAVFLWAINSPAEAGGSDFYIAHGLWNYFVSLVLMILLGSSTGARK